MSKSKKAEAREVEAMERFLEKEEFEWAERKGVSYPLAPLHRQEYETEKYLDTQVAELKQTLKNSNLAFYEAISEPSRPSLMVSRIWPVVPQTYSASKEQRVVFNNLLSHEETTLTFHNKHLTYDGQNRKSLSAKDAVIKIKYVGDPNSYIFYSWDCDHMCTSLHIGHAKDAVGPLRAFLAEFLTGAIQLWELEEFSMFGVSRLSAFLAAPTGVFLCFNRARELWHVEERELDFEPVYYNYYVADSEDDADTVGGVALISQEEMRLYRTQIIWPESGTADIGPADDKTD